MMPRFLRVIGLGAVLVAGGIGAAAAADVPPLPPPLPMPVVQVFSWTGFYIGPNAGWGWTNGSGTFTTALGADPFTVSSNGFLGGAQLGYNWQTGPFVFGAEADFQGTTASGSLNAGAGPTISATAKTPWFGTVRGRVGFSFNNVLFFGTGGLAFGELRATTFGVTESHTNAGWTLGAGAEMAFAPNWSAKVEYLYVDLANSNFVITGASNGYRFGLIRAGVNYRF